MQQSEVILLVLAALVGLAEILLPSLDATPDNSDQSAHNDPVLFSTSHWISRAVDAGPALRLTLLPFILAHWLRDGLRWQLYPAYAALCVPMPHLIIIACIISGFLAHILPVPRMLPLTGKYKVVGTRIFNFTDKSRLDWNENPSGNRKIAVQVWYPGEESSSKCPAPYIPHMDVMGPSISNQFNLPKFALNHFKNLQSRSFQNLDVCSKASERPLPIIIFSHGYSGTRIQNTVLCEELVSRGYVIFSIDHTYDSCTTVFEDGTVAKFRAAAPPHIAEVPQRLQEYRRAQLDIRTHDIAFLIDQIETISKTDGVLRGKLDCDKIAIMGHSFGGATAIVSTHLDKRIKACISLDGWMWPIKEEVLSSGLKRPILHLQGEKFFAEDQPYTRDNRKQVDEFHENSSSPSYVFTIRGVSHYDFSDISFFAPNLMRVLKASGKGAGNEFQHFMTACCEEFLSHHMLQNQVDTLGLRVAGKVPSTISFTISFK